MTALAYAYDPGEDAASMPTMPRGASKFTCDGAMGCFLQTDPVVYEDDLNLFAYVRNDPLNCTDPKGL